MLRLHQEPPRREARTQLLLKLLKPVSCEKGEEQCVVHPDRCLSRISCSHILCVHVCVFRLLELELSLADERTRRESAEEALRVSEDRAKRWFPNSLT